MESIGKGGPLILCHRRSHRWSDIWRKHPECRGNLSEYDCLFEEEPRDLQDIEQGSRDQDKVAQVGEGQRSTGWWRSSWWRAFQVNGRIFFFEGKNCLRVLSRGKLCTGLYFLWILKFLANIVKSQIHLSNVS